ncbi:MAG: hypothetical protein Kow0063_23840 [Anaerolineae bacterium]
MSIQRIVFWGCMMSASLFLAACAAATSPAATTNRDATGQAAIAQTRVFEDAVATSVAATAVANTPLPLSPTPEPAATGVLQTAPTDTPAALPPTAPVLETPTPTPTEEKLQIAESDVDGDDGNDFLTSSSPGNQGRVILLPGFDQAEVSNPMVFRDRIVFRVEVFDSRAGLYDGAGIQDVTFHIEVDDGSGQVVYERREQRPGYCVFGGGEPDCNVLRLEEGSRWPDPFAGEIRNGEYLARIDIVPVEGEPTQWRWRFNIEIPPGQTPYPPDNTARINSITVQDGRYVVDFETSGFEPLLPGQHVHFFFNNVPPEEAGLPGAGPWQIYPAGPGQANTSPFTLYSVDQRPADATQMCILVANADHSVVQGTGNCLDLP